MRNNRKYVFKNATKLNIFRNIFRIATKHFKKNSEKYFLLKQKQPNFLHYLPFNTNKLVAKNRKSTSIFKLLLVPLLQVYQLKMLN